MILLYINNEHCTSVEHLKAYFKDALSSDSDTYADLLDYGRHGDIAVWLRERGESELVSKVENISRELSDSAFYAQLRAAITGEEVTCPESLKPAFDRCFTFDGVECDSIDKEAKISVRLKVLMSVNEKYELSVSCNWGTRAVILNPYDYAEGITITIDFVMHKRPGKEIGEITVTAEDKKLSAKKLPAIGSDKEITVGGVKFKMIHIETGAFTMNEGFAGEHQVTLSSYYIGEIPVTQNLWEAVMGNNPSFFKGFNLPVETVSWYDCQEFIQKLNKKTHKKFRLLTEAEWEYADKGGNKSNHTQYSGSNNIDKVAWYSNNSSSQTHPVKQKKRNELGVYDMSGNVREWCEDSYEAFSGNSQANAPGSVNGVRRACRGGCWYSADKSCLLSFRRFLSPNTKNNRIGFRLAL